MKKPSLPVQFKKWEPGKVAMDNANFAIDPKNLPEGAYGKASLLAAMSAVSLILRVKRLSLSGKILK